MLLALVGCATPLDHEFDADAAPAGGPPVMAGCEPFRAGAPGALAGDLHSLVLADGTVLWLGQLAADSSAVGFIVGGVIGAGDESICTRLSTVGTAVLAASPLQPDGLITPLDLVETDAGPVLYYQLLARDATQPLGVRAVGVGLAPWDGTRFVPTGELLWSADRPVYGASAVRDGDTVYVHGCLSTGAFAAACWLARASVGDVASASAYEYWTGSAWSANPDAAAPVVTDGGPTVSVRKIAARWLMTYVTPLGHVVSVRSAIAPEGPWSAPVALFTCDLAGAGDGAFCAGGTQHPELGDGLVVSVAAATFGSATGTDAYWPRVVAVTIPAALP
jgi:hypothetical protein